MGPSLGGTPPIYYKYLPMPAIQRDPLTCYMCCCSAVGTFNDSKSCSVNILKPVSIFFSYCICCTGGTSYKMAYFWKCVGVWMVYPIFLFFISFIKELLSLVMTFGCLFKLHLPWKLLNNVSKVNAQLNKIGDGVIKLPLETCWIHDEPSPSFWPSYRYSVAKRFATYPDTYSMQ
jgi:hypothetical protein